MLDTNLQYENIANEMIRLRNLQKKLKSDIARYKRVIDEGPFPGKRELTDKERDQLVENFQDRLKRNSWILKKIVYQIKQLQKI